MNFYLIYTTGRDQKGQTFSYYATVTEESKERAKSKLYYYLKEKEHCTDLDMRRCTTHKKRPNAVYL